MGMFDEVICEVPLPDGFDDVFQTKDLDCTLTKYKITNEGRLLRREYAWELNEESPLKSRRVPTGWVDTDFHGILNFYSYDENRKWHEYNAKFTDGQLVTIELKGS